MKYKSCHCDHGKMRHYLHKSVYTDCQLKQEVLVVLLDHTLRKVIFWWNESFIDNKILLLIAWISFNDKIIGKIIDKNERMQIIIFKSRWPKNLNKKEQQKKLLWFFVLFLY